MRLTEPTFTVQASTRVTNHPMPNREDRGDSLHGNLEGNTPLVRTDEELWCAFQAGEDVAFTLVYQRYSGKLYAYLKLLIGTTDRSQLDDLFQEVWIRIFKQRDMYVVKEKGTFAGWLFRLAHNLTVSALRKTRHLSSFDDATLDEELLAAVRVEPIEYGAVTSVEELMALVRKAVERLPLMLREVFILSEYDQLPIETIADTLNISRTNAKVRLYRARKAIREQLIHVIDFQI
ncbi:MAG: sigma-70 family RNA polymerase sigma factor [Candidatus Kapaibacterium sp.]|jgi:RNA polymerase sigma factor (sigma-70 family)